MSNYYIMREVPDDLRRKIEKKYPQEKIGYEKVKESVVFTEERDGKIFLILRRGVPRELIGIEVSPDEIKIWIENGNLLLPKE